MILSVKLSTILCIGLSKNCTSPSLCLDPPISHETEISAQDEDGQRDYYAKDVIGTVRSV